MFSLWSGSVVYRCVVVSRRSPLTCNFKMSSFSDRYFMQRRRKQLAMTVLMAAHLKKLWQAYEEDHKKQQKRRIIRAKRSCWVQPYLQRRVEQGNYENLMQELKNETPELFRNFTRTSGCMFDEIVEKVTPYIEKEETFFRKPLPPGLRVAITLRFLATGETYTSLQYTFRVAHNTISGIVPDTCKAIANVFKNELKIPETEEQWITVAQGFERRWNFPNCIGAIDGKHIRLRNPSHGGSHFFNYKRFYSMVLLAVVDSEYRFMYIDVGAIGSESDAGIFGQTRLRELVEKKLAHIPEPKPLPGTENTLCDYFFVGDDAFPLRHYLMKPFPSRALSHKERLFNYRLSRARRTVENAFGILANRFRVFHSSICLQPQNVETVIIAGCVLHNMLRNRKLINTSIGDYVNQQTNDIVDGLWRGDPPLGQDLPRRVGKNCTQYAVKQRILLRDYVTSSVGSVPWQEKMI